LFTDASHSLRKAESAMRKRLKPVASLLLLLLMLGTFHSSPRLVESESLRHIVILYTNDIHGHLEASESNSGSEGISARWQQEGYDGGKHFLVLDGGDMWTGPVLSTYFQGQSTIDIMNALGYDAVAIGNHDFDFGLEAVQQRAREARFPFLAANLRDRHGNPLDFLPAFTVRNVNDVRIGILGLTTGELLTDTNPIAVENLRLIPYEQALRDSASQARAAGADLLILISHLCKSEAYHLAPLAAEQGIVMIGGGHCHEIVNALENGVLLVQSGAFWDGYTRVDIYFDILTKQVVDIQAVYRRNFPGRDNVPMQALLHTWQAAMPPELTKTIGYLRQPAGRESHVMVSLLTQAWRSAYPQADIVLVSPRYIAQPLPAGYLTPAIWFDVLPTTNTLFATLLTGEQIIAVLEQYLPLYGGLVQKEGRYFLNTGALLDMEARYRVLLPHALYVRYDLQALAPATDTGIDWRQAVIDWLADHPTSPEHPLEEILP